MQKKILLPVLFSIMILSMGYSQDAFAQTYPDFSDLTGLELNGDAAQFGTALRVTENVITEVGSAFFDTPVQISSFSTDFTFKFSEYSTPQEADGLTFVIQDDSMGKNALGGAGTYLGIGGIGGLEITPSVAVTYDTWPVMSENISIIVNGDVFTMMSPYSFDFIEDTIYYNWIDYDGTTLNVYVATINTKPVTPIISQAIDIPTTLGSSTAFAGFTAATGGAFANHDVLSWNFIPDAAVGGFDVSINTASLLLAGASSVSMWMIPVVIAGAGVGVLVISKRK